MEDVGAHRMTDRFVLDHSKLKARPDASKHQVRNVKNWMDNHTKAIQDEETKFIEKDGDLMAFVPTIRTPLRRFIETFDCLRLMWCFQEDQVSTEHNPLINSVALTDIHAFIAEQQPLPRELYVRNNIV